MIIGCREKDALRLALDALRRDEVFVYPTDTLYGFGGNAASENVLQEIYRIKQRPAHMPVSILVQSPEMLGRWAVMADITRKIAEAFLPGALTLVLPALNTGLPERLYSEGGFLGFRIPDHSFCAAMLKHFGAPVVTTSVNISGHPVMNSVRDIEETFKKEVDLFVSDPALDEMQTPVGSTIVKVTASGELILLREGVIPFSSINTLLR